MWRQSDLDPADGSKVQQAAGLVVRHIERGELSVGSRLPSERDLAQRLDLSRVTVVRALEELRARGIIDTQPSSGSVVGATDRLLDPIAPTPRNRPPGRAVLDLRYATTAAPREVADAAERVVGARLREAMASDGSPPGGLPELREALAEHLTGQGIPTLPTHLTLTIGAAAGLDLVLQALALGPGRAVTESPTYPAAVYSLRRHRFDVVGWPAGPTAWDLDQLAHVLRRTRPRLVYLQVDNHNPTGHSLAQDRRNPLVDLVRKNQAVLIADETLRPLWFAGVPQPTALSNSSGVVSIGSFSKTVWGGLRVGWVRAS